MARRTLVVIDDFYDDPDAVRRLALSLDFKRRGRPTYPGGQAAADRNWMPEWRRLRAHIEEPVDAPCPKPTPFIQGLFRLALGPDEKTRIDGVHQDAQRWSAVVYLARNEDCEGGVAFFRHKKSGFLASSRELEAELFGHLRDADPERVEREMLAYLADMNEWEEVQRIAMRYNRAVLLMGQVFHMSAGVFGQTPERGRLTQHFEFYAEGDGHVYE